jgi:putative Mg2+ transporter-C (MgtC) family protein
VTDLDPAHLRFWLPIATALLCGGIVGLERQVRGKPVGVRTGVLICTSTTVFVTLGMQVHAGDPTRVLGQVVTGVGFLGAGVMMVRERSVYGVTTASVIWMLAAIGATIGFGFLRAAIALAALTVFVLIGVQLLESSVIWFARGVYAQTEAQPEHEPDD